LKNRVIRQSKTPHKEMEYME